MSERDHKIDIAWFFIFKTPYGLVDLLGERFKLPGFFSILSFDRCV